MAYQATVDLLLDVDSESEACDATAEILREHLRQFASSSCLIDWRHHIFGGVDFGPVPVGPIPTDFTEDSPWPSTIGGSTENDLAMAEHVRSAHGRTPSPPVIASLVAMLRSMADEYENTIDQHIYDGNEPKDSPERKLVAEARAVADTAEAGLPCDLVPRLRYAGLMSNVFHMPLRVVRSDRHTSIVDSTSELVAEFPEGDHEHLAVVACNAVLAHDTMLAGLGQIRVTAWQMGLPVIQALAINTLSRVGAAGVGLPYDKPIPTETAPAGETRVRRFLDLSTSHLKSETRDALWDAARHGGGAVVGSAWEAITMALHNGEAACFVHVPSAESDHDPLDDLGNNPTGHIPSDLIDVLRYARRAGCDYVMFDRDAPTVEALPVWEA